jgi:hypothetical protein
MPGMQRSWQAKVELVRPAIQAMAEQFDVGPLRTIAGCGTPPGQPALTLAR